MRMSKIEKQMLDMEPVDVFNAIIYIDDVTGEEFSVTLTCTCGDFVDVIFMDDRYDPPLPHFMCPHCDHICRVKGCEDCLIYSKMLDARLLMEEPPKE